METTYHRSKALDYLLILVGTLLMAVSISSVFDPMNLVTGGATGIGIIIKDYTVGLIPGVDSGIPLWLSNLIINIPLFLTAMWIKGKRFLGRTMISTFALSIFLYIVPEIHGLPEDYLLLTIFGAVIMGIGLGLVFLAFSTTGGTDLLAMIIQHKIRHHSVAVIMGVADGVIVVAGAMIFGIEKAMYALIAIVITSKVTDMIVEGFKFSKMAYIITDNGSGIAKTIMEELERGITNIKVTGMYTNDNKDMLLCVVSKKEIIQVKEIVRSLDSNAFVIVSEVKEAVGEGFLQYR